MSKTYCIFSSNYLPHVGGVEVYTQGIAKALARKGNKVIIVTNNCFDLLPRENLSKDVEIYRLPCHPLLNARLPLPKKNKAYRKMMDELASKSIDFVTVNTRFYPHSLEGVRLAEACGIRPVVIDHGSAYLTFGNSFIDIFVKAWEHLFTALLKRHSIDFYGISQLSCEWLKTFGIEAKGAVFNCIDVNGFLAQSSHRDFRSELGIGKDGVIVSFMGRYIPEKGIDAILGAAKKLTERKDVRFLLAGSGPLENHVNNGPENVLNLGRLDRPDVAALMESSDIFCLPTRSEGFCTSLLEASACGKPSIITEVGGAVDVIVDNEHGCIIDSASAECVAERIVHLADNPDERRKIGENARMKVKSCFSWEQGSQRIIDACKTANRKSD